MKTTKTLKTIVFSLGLAAMMLPTTNLNAQINRGLLQNPYKSQDDSRKGGMLRQGAPVGIDSNTGSGIQNDDFSAPLGSGIAILLGAGLGYVALKKKEDEQ